MNNNSDNNQNYIVAIILSLVVIIAFQYFFVRPQEEYYRQQQAAKVAQSQATVPAQTQAPVPAKAADTLRPRMDVINDTPRINIVTPELTGSINLKGALIDDLSLVHYHEGLDPAPSLAGFPIRLRLRRRQMKRNGRPRADSFHPAIR